MSTWLHRLLVGVTVYCMAGCNRKVWEARKRRQCTVAEVQNPYVGRGGRSVTGAHGSITEIQSKTSKEGMEKRVGTEV